MFPTEKVVVEAQVFDLKSKHSIHILEDLLQKFQPESFPREESFYFPILPLVGKWFPLGFGYNKAQLFPWLG